MDSCITTYRKDYLWPYMNILQLRSPTHVALQPQGPLSRIGNGRPPQHQMVGAEYLSLQPKMGPLPCGCCGCKFLATPQSTIPLLNPVLYPAKVGKAPETEVSRYGQPATYLRMLSEKYPYLYNVLRISPPDDLIARVYKDRMLTTYQADYCKMGEQPSKEYDKLVANSGLDLCFPKECLAAMAGGMYRSEHRRPYIYRPAINGRKDFRKKSSVSKDDDPFAGYHPFSTEYTDTFCKVGDYIMKRKLHYHHH